MRYLNYYHYNVNNKIMELTLNHPEDLVSLSTWKVKILNMSKCINLRNLYSWFNIYKKENIGILKNLRMIYSYNDKY